MEVIFRNTENSKTNKTSIVLLNLSQILDIKSPNKHEDMLFKTVLFIILGKI